MSVYRQSEQNTLKNKFNYYHSFLQEDQYGLHMRRTSPQGNAVTNTYTDTHVHIHTLTPLPCPRDKI